MSRVKRPLGERFWELVDQSGGPDACWPWLLRRDRGGYGMVKVDGKNRKASRIAYQLQHGPLPDHLVPDHLCHTNDPTCNLANDCPHRACCNPAHMEAVTKGENCLRGNGPSAINARRTHCREGHPLVKIKWKNSRGCPICTAKQVRAWRSRPMDPLDERHGTIAGYVAGCRNTCCMAASAAYARQRRRMKRIDAELAARKARR